MPDGRLLHLRDTYPVETAWAPRYVGDELRQVRAAAWEARPPGLRAAVEAAAARQRGDHGTATSQHDLAASYRALHEVYKQRENVFSAVMADRDDWDAATRAQRHLAVAADAELRRRHPDQPYLPLRSAETVAISDEQRGEIGQLITNLAAAHRTFAERLADRQKPYHPLPRSRLRRPRPGVPALAPVRPGCDLAAAEARDPAVLANTRTRRRPRRRLEAGD